MKILVQLVRVVVGLLFIFSGLVKANDPMGLSYKMQEFFEVWRIHGFDGTTLTLSVLMNAFEIIAGFALLIGWRIRLFGWLLLALIVFFTFLTGYTYFTGKPKNCGCFGDCLPITSKTSFLKDVALTILIGFLIWKQQYIRPLFTEKIRLVLMALVTILSFGFQWYTLKYLPVVDCLPFKKGKNIVEQMKMPANATPDSTVITFVYKKDGKELEFTQFPSDFNKDTYTFVKRYDKLVREGKNNKPPIQGFLLTAATDAGSDYTSLVLDQPYAVVLFIEKFSSAGSNWKTRFEKVVTAAKAKNVPVYIITAESGKAAEALAGTSLSTLPVLTCDYKTIEVAARTPAVMYLLQKGTILNKWSSPSFGKGEKQVAKLNVQQTPAVVIDNTVSGKGDTLAPKPNDTLKTKLSQ